MADDRPRPTSGLPRGARLRMGSAGSPRGSAALAFLADDTLATGGRLGLTLWDVRTGDHRLLPLPGVWQRSLAVSPAGTLWTGDDEGVLREWDLGAGRVTRRLDGLVQGTVVGLVVSRGALALHWISGQGFLGTVDLASGKLRGEPSKPDRFGEALVSSPGGDYLAVITSHAVLLMDGEMKQLRRRFEYGGGRSRPRCATFSPDGSHLVVGLQTPPRLEVYRLPSLTPGPLHQLEVGQSGAYRLAFLPDGETLAVGQIRDTTLLAFPRGEELGRLSQGDGGYVAGLAASPDGSTLAIHGAEGGLRFWDPVRLRTSLAYHDEGAILDVAVCDELDLVVTGDEAGRVRRFRLADGMEAGPAYQYEFQGAVICRVEFDQDGGLEALGNENHDAVVPLWIDPVSGAETGRGERERDGRAFLPAYSLDGSLVVRQLRPRSQLVVLEDLTIGRVLGEKVPHRGDTPAPGTRLASFHPSGRYCATGGDDHTIRVHRVPDFQEVLALEEPLALRPYFPEGPKWRGRRLVFSPDGRLLALGGVEGLLILYELELVRARQPGELLRVERRVQVVAHAAPIHALAFGRSSSLLVTASSDGSALVWDVDQLLSLDHQSLDLPPGG